MPCIVEDPTWAVCPSFQDPEWEFLRQTMIDAHQGDQCSVCHTRFPDEGGEVWRPGLCRYGRRSLGGTFREVRNEEETSMGDN
jgi:hypothetical protein